MHNDHQEGISTDLESLLLGGAAEAGEPASTPVDESCRPDLGVLNASKTAHHAALQTLMTAAFAAYRSPGGYDIAGRLFHLARGICWQYRLKSRFSSKREPGRASAAHPSLLLCRYRRLIRDCDGRRRY